MHEDTPIDSLVAGWDPTPGIVSVWADREGRVLVWRRLDGRVLCEQERFRPWLLACGLDDLVAAGARYAPEGTPAADRAAVTYRELDGPPGDYRYLLSARSGTQLERLLCAGAASRLGQPVRRLADLPDYLTFGPVEQYLLLSGRSYFRGLVYDDLHRLQFDLETTALDPQRGRILLVALRDTHGLATTLEAPAPEDEPALIAELCALIRQRDPDVIENHNLFGFDLPFLEGRAAQLGLPLALGRAGAPPLLLRVAGPSRGAWRNQARYSVAGRELIDTLDAVRRHDFVVRDLSSYRLKDVARSFGVAGPERVYLAGEEIVTTYRRDPELVRRYALDDVAEVAALSHRLLPAAFALAGMAPRRYERVAAAGPATGILEPMLVRAYLHAGTALPCQEAEQHETPHAGGAAYLFASGLAERVVKTDIASLYPSLMRTYRIGPQCDRLMALLQIVDRLTELRLHHKAAARVAPAGSLVQSHHQALQAAMKLVINSAYGYMGAGSLVLFADRAAADEVTRRGRAVLDLVVAELRGRGVALLEADTDGVYFAVPAGWDEARERVLVAEVAAQLPAGIQLEYEGRYQAMLSHQIKNYALLTYDGQLVLRGVAFRSRRVERFAERFLQAALACLLRGDILGLHRVYRETVADIQERRMSADDMAVQTRLSKSPAQYTSRRATMREAMYEALLEAGRTDWAPGERIRWYRAADGTAVWLPDAADVAEGRAVAVSPRPYDVGYYLRLLQDTYLERLRQGLAPEDFDQLFRRDAQLGLFDRPLEQIQPRWVRCAGE